MRSLVFLGTFLLLIFVSDGAIDSSYTILAAKFIHPQSQYVVPIESNNIETFQKIELTIDGPDFSQTQEATLDKSELSDVVFDLPDLVEGAYKLNVRSITGPHIEETRDLICMKHQPKFLIQTDKGLYKTNEWLQFRILAVNDNYRPVEVKDSVNVLIKDSSISVVKTFDNIQFENGVFMGQAIIPENIYTGNWHLEVVLNNEVINEVGFVVIQNETDEYRLPTKNHENSFIVDTLKAYETGDLEIEVYTEQNTDLIFLNSSWAINVRSSVPMNYVTYHIIGRGKVLFSERIELEIPKYVYELYFAAPQYNESYSEMDPESNTNTLDIHEEMAPLFKVIVHFIDHNGELHYREKIVFAYAELKNKIAVTHFATPNIPGSGAYIQIQAAPESYIGVLIVAADKNADIPSYNNDINEAMLLRMFGTYLQQPKEATNTIFITNAKQTNVALKRNQYVPPKYSEDVAQLNPPTIKRTWYMGGYDKCVNSAQTMCRASFDLNAPQTPGEWSLTAFALSPTHGLGVTTETYHISTHIPYSRDFQLPPTVIIGEIVEAKIIVTNHLDKEIIYRVSVTRDPYYGTFEPDDKDGFHGREIRLKARSTGEVTFAIRFTKIGLNQVIFENRAYDLDNNIVFDHFEREWVKTNVISDHPKQYGGKISPYAVHEGRVIDETIQVERPEDMIPNSESFMFSVYGDFLSPMFENLDKLAKDTLEQTISSIALLTTVWLSMKEWNIIKYEQQADFERKLYDYHQQLLKYRNPNDGSFSAFVYDDKQVGSIWLTAFVANVLPMLEENFEYQTHIRDKALSYLADQQMGDGGFKESPAAWINEKQRNSVALTAQVLLALISDAATYATEIELATNYLLRNLDQTDSSYAKAVAICALSKIQHQQTATKFTTMITRAKHNEEQTWWSDGARITSDDIEATAYMLHTALDLELAPVQSYLPIVSWLVEHGGVFYTNSMHPTQTTVVVFLALRKFEDNPQFTPEGEIKWRFRTENVIPDLSTVNYYFPTIEDPIFKFKVKLDQDLNKIDITPEIRGKTFVIQHYDYQYFIEKQRTPEIFDVFVELPEVRSTPILNLKLKICFKYRQGEISNNLVIVEVNLPTGYVSEEGSMDAINASAAVKHVTVNNAKTKFILFVTDLESTQFRCVPIKAKRFYNVSLQKATPIVIYEYNDYSRITMTNYKIPSTECDICQPNRRCPIANC